jgi:hypothetical protein
MNFFKIFNSSTIFFCFLNIHSASVVYSLKISETTRHAVSNEEDYPLSFNLSSVNSYREEFSGVREKILSCLASLIYSPVDYYIRADFGFASLNRDRKKLNFSKMEIDDFLLTAGKSKNFNDKIKLSFSGLFGIPTHKDYSIIQPLQFGIGHFGLGLQLDGSCVYSSDKKHSIFGAARFIYFLPRIIDGFKNSKFDYDPGNLVDLFISHQSVWKKSRVEFGYDATFAFNPSILPCNKVLLEESVLQRNSFFLTYSHDFFIQKYLAGLLFGFSYGFDTLPCIFGFKKILSFWVSGSISF